MPRDSSSNKARAWWWDYFYRHPDEAKGHNSGAYHLHPNSRPQLKAFCRACFDNALASIENTEMDEFISLGRERRSTPVIKEFLWGQKGNARNKRNNGSIQGYLVSHPSTLLNHLTRCPNQLESVRENAARDHSTTTKTSPSKAQKSSDRYYSPSQIPFPLAPSATPHFPGGCLSGELLLHPSLSHSPATRAESDMMSIAPSDSLSARASGSAWGSQSQPLITSNNMLPSPAPYPNSFLSRKPSAGPSTLNPAFSQYRDMVPLEETPSPGPSRIPTPAFSRNSASPYPQLEATPARIVWSSSLQTKFEEQVARLTAAANLPLSWVDNPEWHRLVEFFIPGFRSPSRKSLTNRIIPTIIERSRSSLKNHVQGQTVTIQADRWTGQNFTHLVAVMITVAGKLYTLQVHDASCEQKTADNLLELLNGAIRKVENEFKGKVVAVVTDASGECRKAKRDLVAERPSMIVLDCFAHQVNLIVGDYFNGLLETNSLCMDKANELVSFLRSKTQILGELRRLKCRTVIRPVLTRWSAHLNAYTRLLELRPSLEFIARTDLGETVEEKVMLTGSSAAKRKARAMINTLLDPVFWHSLTRFVHHLRPLGEISNLFQATFTRLDTVLLSFGYLVSTFKNMALNDTDDTVGAQSIIDSIEKRWDKTDQDVLIAAVILNPIYCDTLFNTYSPYSNLLGVIALLEKLWSRLHDGKSPPASFTREIRDYLDTAGRYMGLERAIEFEVQDAKSDSELLGKYRPPHPINIYQILGFKDNRETDFSRFAKHILDISANSASCERLFSAFGTILTRLRNRLLPRNLLNISELAVQVRDEHLRDAESQCRLCDIIKSRAQSQSTTEVTMAPISNTIATPTPPDDSDEVVVGALGRFSSLIQPHREAARADTNDSTSFPDTDTITGSPYIHTGGHIRIEDLFDLQSTGWKEKFGKDIAKSFEEDLELFNLLNLDAKGVDDEEVDGVEGEIPSFDETTEQILLRR